MTAVIMKDSPTTPYDALHRRILVSLRDVPTRALLWIFILGASVNLLLSAALRLMSNDRRLFFPYSTTLLASSVAPALIALFLGESAASRELAERYAGSTGKDVWRAHTSTARQILAMGIPYALVCAGCELVISGGNADPANIWSSFPSPIRWALLPVIVILSYYLGASIGAIKLRHPTCSTLIRIFVGIVFFIGIQALRRTSDSSSFLAPYRLSGTSFTSISDRLLSSVHRSGTHPRSDYLPPADPEDIAITVTVSASGSPPVSHH